MFGLWFSHNNHPPLHATVGQCSMEPSIPVLNLGFHLGRFLQYRHFHNQEISEDQPTVEKDLKDLQIPKHGCLRKTHPSSCCVKSRAWVRFSVWNQRKHPKKLQHLLKSKARSIN